MNIMLTAQEWLSENSERQELAVMNIPLAMELYAKYRETELSRPPKDVVEAMHEYEDIMLKEYLTETKGLREVISAAALHGYSLASGDKWVSVSERYPTEEESEDELLVCLANGHRFTANYLGNIKEYKETGLHFDFVPHENNDITHWKPLPSPPKQQQ